MVQCGVSVGVREREREKREVVEKVRFASGAAQQQASKHVQVRLAGGQRL